MAVSAELIAITELGDESGRFALEASRVEYLSNAIKDASWLGESSEVFKAREILAAAGDRGAELCTRLALMEDAGLSVSESTERLGLVTNNGGVTSFFTSRPATISQRFRALRGSTNPQKALAQELERLNTEIATIAPSNQGLMRKLFAQFKTASTEEAFINKLDSSAKAIEGDKVTKGNFLTRNPKTVFFGVGVLALAGYMAISGLSLKEAAEDVGTAVGDAAAAAIGGAVRALMNGLGLGHIGTYLVIGGSVVLFIICLVIYFKYIRKSGKGGSGGGGGGS